MLLDDRLDTDEAITTGPQRRVRRFTRVSVAYWAISIVALIGITTWLYGPHVFDGGRILNQPRFDWAQEVWFLAWPAYAIQHGLNPFYSNWMNYPTGLNLMENTSMPLLGVVFAPITWLFGPTVTYSVVLRVAMISSACSAQWVARRLGLSRTASFLAGLLYAFSSIAIVEGNGHAFLTFLALPPLIGYAIYGIVVDRYRPVRAGMVVGALFGAQALISLEVALMTAIACVVGTLAAVACFPRSITVQRARTLAVASGSAIIVAAAVLVVPMIAFFGRGHFWGPAHPTLSIYRTNLESLVVPGRFTWLSPVGVHLPHKLVFLRENGAYLGIFVLATLVAVAIRGWRTPLVRIGTVTLGALLVLSLGNQLNVTGTSTGIPLPFAVLSRLPFLDSLSPVRLFLVMSLLVALLCGWGLDQALAWASSRDRQSSRARSIRTAGVVAAAVAVCLSLMPAHGYPSRPTVVPSWLASSEGTALVPSGSVVLFYPYPTLADNHPMLIQAEDGFRYKIIGGQGIVSTSQNKRHAIAPLYPYQVPAVFLRASTGALTAAPTLTIFGLPRLPPLDKATTQIFREFVAVHRVSAIVITSASSPSAQLVIVYLAAAFGPPRIVAGGSLAVWSASILDRRRIQPG